MDFDAAIPEFVRRTAETVAWCSRLPDDASVEALRPASLPGACCFIARSETHWPQTLDDFHLVHERDRACVDRLAHERRRLLGDLGSAACRAQEWAPRGRFLTIAPWHSMFTQAMGPGSRGFFEFDGDLPPWATWIGYYVCPLEEYRPRYSVPGPGGCELLVCWVPPTWIDAALGGMREDELGQATLWLADDPKRMALRVRDYLEGREPVDRPWADAWNDPPS